MKKVNELKRFRLLKKYHGIDLHIIDENNSWMCYWADEYKMWNLCFEWVNEEGYWDNTFVEEFKTQKELWSYLEWLEKIGLLNDKGEKD